MDGGYARSAEEEESKHRSGTAVSRRGEPTSENDQRKCGRTNEREEEKDGVDEEQWKSVSEKQSDDQEIQTTVDPKDGAGALRELLRSF